MWEETNVGHTWESAVQEDDQGRIVVQGDGRNASLSSLLKHRRRRLEQNNASLRHKRLRRDMIRYLYLVLDASRWMMVKDPTLPPGTRLEVTVELVREFAKVFLDENPLSQLGIVWVRQGEAELVSPLSSHFAPHETALQSLLDYVNSGHDAGGGGEFSLQNGLEVAGRSLGHQPRHASREIVVVAAALSTCDPGCNLLADTLPRLQQAHIRVSYYHLAAELYVSRKLATETGGCASVCLDRTQFRDWLWNQTVPPPQTTSTTNTNTTITNWCEMVRMGFPSRTVSAIPSLVHGTATKQVLGTSWSSGITNTGTGTSATSTNQSSSSKSTVWLARTAYTCPQCQAKNASLPTDCAVCGLKLVVAPHLARSFHHLFPVPPFAQILVMEDEPEQEDKDPQAPADDKKKKKKTNNNNNKSTSSSALVSSSSSSSPSPLSLTKDLLLDSSLDDTCCFACTRPLWAPKPTTSNTNDVNNNTTTLYEWLRFACPDCHNVFCFDCDAFLHERLHNCPGCLAVRS